MSVGQRIPRRHRQIDVVLIATRTGILHSDDNRITGPAHAIISCGTGVGDLDFAPTVRARGMLGHPEGTHCYSHGAVGTGNTTGAEGARGVGVDGADTVVAGRISEGS